jgi:hypothetical protein
MPTYRARSIDIRLRASNLADSTSDHPELQEAKITHRQADFCTSVLANGVWLQEDLVKAEDGLGLHLCGDENQVPVYIVHAKYPPLRVFDDGPPLRTRKSVSNAVPTKRGTHLLATAPIALAVDINIGSKALRSVTTGLLDDDPDFDLGLGSAIGIRSDVFVNGTLIDSEYMDPINPRRPITKSSSDGSLRHVVTGKRVDMCLQKPLVLCPPGLDVHGELIESRARVGRLAPMSRLAHINTALCRSATELKRWGSSSPLSEAITSLSELPVPEELLTGDTKSTSLSFGVIDVFISLGRGQRERWWKLTRVLKHPIEYTDMKYARDRLQREGNHDWYTQYVHDHVNKMIKAQSRAMKMQEDETGYALSDEDAASLIEKPQTVSQTRLNAALPFTKSAMLIEDNTDSYDYTQSEKLIGNESQQQTPNNSADSSRKRRCRRLREEHLVLTRQNKSKPTPHLAASSTTKGSNLVRDVLPSGSNDKQRQKAVETLQNGSRHPLKQSTTPVSHGNSMFKARDQHTPEELEAWAEYNAGLKDEKKNPLLCQDSVVAFAEKSDWQSAGELDKGGCHRPVREWRMARFDDEEVVLAVRFILV